MSFLVVTTWGIRIPARYFIDGHTECQIRTRCFYYRKVPPPQGQGRFIKIADPSVCPTGGDFFFWHPLKYIVFYLVIVKNYWRTWHVFHCVFCLRHAFLSLFQTIEYACVFIISGGVVVHGGCVLALHHIIRPSFCREAFVHRMLFVGTSHRSV